MSSELTEQGSKAVGNHLECLIENSGPQEASAEQLDAHVIRSTHTNSIMLCQE